jgi:peptidoglycan hydrolase-like protein with peptidoglycan-binding domain
MNTTHLALLGAGVVGLVAAAAALPSPAEAAAAPPPPTPLLGPAVGATPATGPEPANDRYTPPSTLLQSRPMARADVMSAGQKRDTIAIAQGQLNAIGYGPLRIDGINGPRTQSAAARFNVDHAPAVAAYLSSVGNDRGIVYAIDDAYRSQISAAPAPDHVAPSASLWSPSRSRG